MSASRDRLRCARRFALGVPSILALLALGGCKNDDMAAQPKVKAYEATEVFANGTEAQWPVAGTVARPPADVPGTPYSMQWSPGPVGAGDMTKSVSIPVPITPELIARGQERFDIYCAVCHGRLGDGNGMVVQRGMIQPPSFHNDRLSDPKQTPDWHFYDVISNGRGAMFSYAERVAPADRWAITAYIRVLQESVRQAARRGDIPPAQYAAMKGTRP